MAGKLILLPLRVWVRSARLLTRAGVGAAERAISLAGQTIGVASSDGADDGRGPGPRPGPQSSSAGPGWREESIEEPISPVEVEHPQDESERRPTRKPTQPSTARARTVSPVGPPREEPEAPVVQEPVEEPVHVSEEPELVREEAESGAEDGAGAQLTVTEPWNGYARMSARDVIARARQSGAAELAAVRLYESRHRSRQTVLAAVDRQLKLVSGPNPAG